MYLLDIFDSNVLPIAIVAGIISYAILYQIIVSAVRSGNKELLLQLRLLNQLKVDEMKKQGSTTEEIAKAIDSVFPPKN